MAFPVDALINFTISEILEIKAQCFKDIKAGRAIIAYGDQGTNVSKQFTAPPGEVMVAVNFALRELDPDTYGSNRAGRRVHSNYGGTSMSL